MKKKRLFAVLTVVAMCVALSACGRTGGSGTDTGSGSGTVGSTSDSTAAAIAQTQSDMFSKRDLDGSYDLSEATKITGTGAEIKLEGSGATAQEDRIVIDAAGTYVLTGEIDKEIVIEAGEKDKIQLVLSAVKLTNASGAAIYAKEADKVFVTLEGSNTISAEGDFATLEDDKVDAAIYAKCDLTFNGSGEVVLSSGAHGIVSKKDLVFAGCSARISSAKDGISGKNSVRIASGYYVIQSERDAIQSSNEDKDGKGYVYIVDGDFSLTTGGGSADADMKQEEMFPGGGGPGGGGFPGGGGPGWGGFGGGFGRKEDKGGRDFGQATDLAYTESQSASSGTSAKAIKASDAIAILGGTFQIDSKDDAMHSNGDLTIAGGTITILSGDDGMHADDDLTIEGGSILIQYCYEGIEATNVTINGGTIDVTANDDGINAAGGNDGSSVNGRPGQNPFGGGSGDATITINGGTITVRSVGDGLDVNGTLTVTGGNTIVYGPTSDFNGALDYDGKSTVSGGTIIALGSKGMAQGFTTSEQPSIMVTLSQTEEAGKVTLYDSNGNMVISVDSPKQFASVVISTPDLKKSEKYTLETASGKKQVSCK